MHPLIVIPLNPKESNRPLIDLTSVVPNYDVLYSTVRGLIITRSSLTEQLALSSLQLAAVYSVISSPGCNFLFFAYKRYFFQLNSGRISFSISLGVLCGVYLCDVSFLTVGYQDIAFLSEKSTIAIQHGEKYRNQKQFILLYQLFYLQYITSR